MRTIVWERNDDAPFDIWMQQSEIEPIKAFLAKLDFNEFFFFFGDRKLTEAQRDAECDEFVERKKDDIPFERVLSFSAGMFGNNPNRSITILNGKDVVERWQMKIINK